MSDQQVHPCSGRDWSVHAGLPVGVVPMMERRAHWTDDLIAAVIGEIGVLRPSPPPLANTAYAVIAAVEDWVYDNFQGGEYDNPVEYTPEELAIQRVRELHNPIPGFNGSLWCGAHCEATADGDPTEYPCETIRALDGGAE